MKNDYTVPLKGNPFPEDALEVAKALGRDVCFEFNKVDNEVKPTDRIEDINRNLWRKLNNIPREMDLYEGNRG